MTLNNAARGLFFSLVALAGLDALAQNVSSSVLGTVMDPTGSVIPGATITLKNQGTAAVVKATSDGSGLFRFVNIGAGTYTLNVQDRGFKTRVEQDILIGSSEIRDLGRITLALGDVAEQVSVSAEATPIQTASAEKSATVDGAQLNTEALKGRDLMGYMRIRLPTPKPSRLTSCPIPTSWCCTTWRMLVALVQRSCWG
jgi:hypothetical protein